MTMLTRENHRRVKVAHLQVRCSDRWKDRLRAYCEAAELDMSDVVRAAVTEFLERQGDGFKEQGQ